MEKVKAFLENDYVKIARPDHWFKNIFMIPGIFFCWMVDAPANNLTALYQIVLSTASVCLICSANYTINEFLDGPEDAKHPTKKYRPAAQGRINGYLAFVQWAVLAATGLLLSNSISIYLVTTNIALLVMGLIYNVKPVRSKDIPYLDVLSESVNNPLRFFLGWYAFGAVLWPPASLVFAYWMLGAFFMAVKRFAEIRNVKDNNVLSSYRKSFSYYTAENLTISILVYSSAFAFFSGAFMVKYKLELLFTVPFYSLFMGAYMFMGFKKNSPVQNPETLYKHTKFMKFCFLIVVITYICLIINVPLLYKIFETTVPEGF